MNKINKFLRKFMLTTLTVIVTLLELAPLCLMFGSTAACIAQFVLYLCSADLYYQSITWVYWFGASAIVLVALFIRTLIDTRKKMNYEKSEEAKKIREQRNAVPQEPVKEDSQISNKN